MQPTTQDPFNPLNDLERELISAQAGQTPLPVFLAGLINAQVFVVLNREIPASGDLTGVVPLLLRSATGQTMLAVFTAPERATPMVAHFPEYASGLLTSFAWLLKFCTDQTGVVINPGWRVGMEIPPDGVSQIRKEFGV